MQQDLKNFPEEVVYIQDIKATKQAIEIGLNLNAAVRARYSLDDVVLADRSGKTIIVLKRTKESLDLGAVAAKEAQIIASMQPSPAPQPAPETPAQPETKEEAPAPQPAPEPAPAETPATQPEVAAETPAPVVETPAAEEAKS